MSYRQYAAYDTTFFFIVNIFSMNLTVDVIVDTFVDLRALKDQNAKDGRDGFCFKCSEPFRRFESLGGDRQF